MSPLGWSDLHWYPVTFALARYHAQPAGSPYPWSVQGNACRPLKVLRAPKTLPEGSVRGAGPYCAVWVYFCVAVWVVLGMGEVQPGSSLPKSGVWGQGDSCCPLSKKDMPGWPGTHPSMHSQPVLPALEEGPTRIAASPLLPAPGRTYIHQTCHRNI